MTNKVGNIHNAFGTVLPSPSVTLVNNSSSKNTTYAFRYLDVSISQYFISIKYRLNTNTI